MQNPRILVVDDDAGVRSVIADRLMLEGYRVSTASGGFEALDVVTRHPDRFALIVSDVRMPEGSGIELLEGLGKLSCDTPPVFVFSAYSDYSSSEINALGGAGFFQKPYDLEKIVSRIETWLGSQA